MKRKWPSSIVRRIIPSIRPHSEGVPPRHPGPGHGPLHPNKGFALVDEHTMANVGIPTNMQR